MGLDNTQKPNLNPGGTLPPEPPAPTGIPPQPFSPPPSANDQTATPLPNEPLVSPPPAFPAEPISPPPLSPAPPIEPLSAFTPPPPPAPDQFAPLPEQPSSVWSQPPPPPPTEPSVAVPTWPSPPPQPEPQPLAEPVIPSGAETGLGGETPVPIPTFTPSSPEPLSYGLGSAPAPTPEMTAPMENAPTDLSNLVQNLGTPTPLSPATEAISPQPEEGPSLPSTPPEEDQVVTTGSSGGFPKWVLVIGALVLILIVSAVSAYFILGIGKPASVSAPAEQPPLTNPPKSIIPTLPAARLTPASTPSAGFGDLGGATPSGTGQTSTPSAIDILRQQAR